MAFNPLTWTQFTEAVVGRNHPTLSDTDNRALRAFLTTCGINPDSPFSGFPLGTIYVDFFGAVGDGATDDTAAIQAAENARTAGQTLKFTPGKTYLLAQTTGATILKSKVAGAWDLTGVTLQYGSTVAMKYGSDSAPLGIVNVLAGTLVFQGGIIDGNGHAVFGVAILQTQGHVEFRGTVIQNLNHATNSYWCGVAYWCSIDVSGVSVTSTRAKRVFGYLSLPQAPVVNGIGAIVAHVDVSASLMGGDQIFNDCTGFAWCATSNTADIVPMYTGVMGILDLPHAGLGNQFQPDFIVHDIDTNAIETYGVGALGYGMGSIINGHMNKQCASGWYHYIPVASDTVPPNVLFYGQSAGNNAAPQQGYGWVAGQFAQGNVTPAAGASFTPDFSKGNDFVFPANASPTINAPTNPLVNPTGLSLVQFFNVTIRNATVGAITTTWNAAYHLAGAWTDPATLKERSIWFRYDVVKGIAYEISRSAADVTT